MYSKDLLADKVSCCLKDIEYPRELGSLSSAVRYGLEAGGKHLRPVLTLATCLSLGGDEDTALNQALAIEIFHNFTLVHDDVMDHSPLRRGKPTVAAKYGEEMAILSGDATLTLAYMMLMRGAGDCAARVFDCFNAAANEVYAGQELDMQFEERLDVTPGEYLRMIMLKTAALLRCATMLGAIMAHAPRTSLEAMDAYAMGLGMAFQLRDDYLDTYGDEATFGKPIGGDIVNNKKTWLLTTALHSDRAEDVKALIEDKSIDDADKIARMKEIYDDLNLPKKCSDLIAQYSEMAVNALNDADMGTEHRKFFADIANACKTRDN